MRVINRALGNMLWSLVGDNVRSWETKLPQAEFAHNHANNRSLGFSPFQVVYGNIPRGPLALTTLPDTTRLHGTALDFVTSLHEVHSKAITWKIQQQSIRRLQISIDANSFWSLVIWFG